ncbi:Mitochondrial intermediate peptidase [Gonapodya sp. JEL0774]|nr:Mitochondrial intermediate peptidase [Gonapodya sp. JEL0774]
MFYEGTWSPCPGSTFVPRAACARDCKGKLVAAAGDAKIPWLYDFIAARIIISFLALEPLPFLVRSIRSLPQHVTDTARRIQLVFDGSQPPADRLLDSPHSARSHGTFSHSSTRYETIDPSPGLFSLPGLTSPISFLELARRAVARANLIVDHVTSTASNASELVRVVKRLDRLSDEVCAVVDAAEVVRSLHPEPEWRRSAEAAHEEVSAVLNRLNTHRELYETLHIASSTPNLSSTWSSTEIRVAELLLADFRRSGIHITDPAKLSRFASLNDQILNLAHRVARGSHTPAQPHVIFDNPWRDLAGCGAGFIREAVASAARARLPQGTAIAPTTGSAIPHILRTCRVAATRRLVYTAYNNPPPTQIAALDSMLNLRAQLALETGFDSYADAFLAGTMAGSRGVVESFLDRLNAENLPRARREVDELAAVKKARGEEGLVAPWDRAYLMSLMPRKTTSASFRTVFGAGSHTVPIAADPTLSLTSDTVTYSGIPNLTLGTVLSRVSVLFHHLYGVHFVPTTVGTGEVWHDSVIRLDAVHEHEGFLGTVYVDAGERDGKGGGAAHYTVRCGRRIDWDTVDDGWLVADEVESAMRAEAKEAKGAGGELGLYKMPVVVVGVSVGRTLSEQEVETVFHEMGHAVHSLLARPPFQHVSGTRCALDLVEVPSILHELLTSIAIPSFPTAAAIPAMDLQHQIRLAAMDQRLHGSAREIVADGWTSVDVARAVRTSHDAFPIDIGDPNALKDTSHARFAHLAAYGAGYYSYLWSRRWAGRINAQILAPHPFGSEGFRAAGETIRRELLEWGGGRDGWMALERVGVVKGGEREGAVTVEEVGGTR